MLFLKICGGIWENESRDLRELSVIREIGADIEVIAKGEFTGVVEQIEGYEVTRVSTRPLGKHFPNSINRIVALFTWAHFIRRFEADIISGHDLLGLLIGYMSNFKKKKKAKLIYDAHEFEAGRAGGHKRISKFFIIYLERFLMSKCTFSIMVNDSIADEVQRLYKQKKRAIVVRNIPEYLNINEEVIKRTRNYILAELGADKDTFLVMYHGAIFRERGIEIILQAISKLKNVCGIILGDGDSAYKNELLKKCEMLEIKDRIFFHKAVPKTELYSFIGASDVGMITIPGIYKSYYYMLPNKFFENIQSLTPVIVSDFPEIGNLTSYYKIGLKVNPADVIQVMNAIKKMRDDKEFYAKCKENLKQAKKELCWENEKKSLENAYRKVIL